MLPSGITYVRHAMPVTDASAAPSEWHLDAEGRHLADALAHRLEVAPGIGRLVSSTEPKAVETAERIGARWGAEVHVDRRPAPGGPAPVGRRRLPPRRPPLPAR